MSIADEAAEVSRLVGAALMSQLGHREVGAIDGADYGVEIYWKDGGRLVRILTEVCESLVSDEGKRLVDLMSDQVNKLEMTPAVSDAVGELLK